MMECVSLVLMMSSILFRNSLHLSMIKHTRNLSMEMNSKNLKDSSSIMQSLIIRINKEKMTIMEYQSE